MRSPSIFVSAYGRSYLSVYNAIVLAQQNLIGGKRVALDINFSKILKMGSDNFRIRFSKGNSLDSKIYSAEAQSVIKFSFFLAFEQKKDNFYFAILQ